MIETKTTIREELIIEVLIATNSKISIRDFDIQCQLAPSTSGKSYYDRLRTAEQLFEQKIIDKIDNRLVIVAKHVPEWLKKGMLIGAKSAWEIFELIDGKGKIKEKINLELLASIGFDGEIEVIRKLEEVLPTYAKARIKHISITNDTAGFDISSPSTLDPDYMCLLEVKTSSQPGEDFRFFISRNEARVASQNENWRLVAVRREPSGYKILGHLRYVHFAEVLPCDSNKLSRWESASIALPLDLFIPTLP